MVQFRHTDIPGFVVGQKPHKLALYANNLLFYVASPTTSMPIIFKEFVQFGVIRNFKVNPHKSEFLNIFLPHTLVSSLCASFPFQLRSEHIKYLEDQETYRLISTFSRKFLSLT